MKRAIQRHPHRLAVTALGVGLALLATACGDDDDDGDAGAVSTTAASETQASTADTATSDSMTDDTMTDDSTLEDRIDAASEALSDGDFSTMLELLNLSGLGDEIEGRSITILAPTEAAFDELTADELSDLATNPTQLDDVLRRHLIDGVLSYEELTEMTEVETMSGDVLVVSFDDGELTIDGAVVHEPTTDATSGEPGQEVAVFGIEKVILGD
jgi:uncharacterized surface protein with fasciclin (FAS1) repeats